MHYLHICVLITYILNALSAILLMKAFKEHKGKAKQCYLVPESHGEVWHLEASKYQGREITLNHHSITSVRYRR